MIRPLNLSGLNPEQRDAVEHTEGPLLVLAGAGSGKTRVITFRIAHLLNKGVRPQHILALSFTNKAATEMKDRLVALVGPIAQKCHTSTFHALGVRFIKEEHKAAGLQPRFTIIDEGDQLGALRQVMSQLHLDPKQHDPKEVFGQISNFKSQLINPASRADARTAAMCYEGYLRRLRVMNCVDFDDLIRLPVVLMESNREVKLRWRTRFKYIMVDEYQDTNGAQLRMLKALAELSQNICVVGDDDQSIYGWRGAVASNILRFDEHFPNARTIALTQNYRSTNFILKAANHVIENNPERHPKTLWSAHGDGEKLRYRLLDHGDHEAEWVTRKLISAKSRGELKWSDLAILYRTNQQARGFEESLRTLQIPYRVIGGTQFFDRKEIRDAFSYLRLLVNTNHENALRRVINYPQRGIGDGTVERLSLASQGSGMSMWALCGAPERIEGLTPTARRNLMNFHQLITPFQPQVHQRPWSKVFLEMMNAVKIREALAKQYREGNQALKRWSNILDVAQGLENAQQKGFDTSLNDYINRMTLDHRPKDEEEAKEELTLMSLHGSKGLEFHTVFIVGCEEEWMPHERVIDEGGSIDEERRLVYVGITRAQRALTLTGARKRLSYGKPKLRKPSRFLLEIPEELFEGGREGGEVEPERSEEVKKSHRDQAFARMFASLNKP